MSRRAVCVDCGHTGSVHALNTARKGPERCHCIVSKCGCPAYRAPAHPGLLDLTLDLIAEVARHLPTAFGRRP